MKTPPPAAKRRYWLLSADPHHYHWDTLFVKGKELYRLPNARPENLRQLKLTRRGDRILCYHAAPERALYAIAEVFRDPYPDPLDPEHKNMVVDIRSLERLPRQVKLEEMRENRALRGVKFLKNVRLTISSLEQEQYAEILCMAGIVAQPGFPLP